MIVGEVDNNHGIFSLASTMA